MPRPQRHFIPQVPVHVVQRGHSKEAIFYSDKDYAVFRKALLRAASKSSCHVHAYALMTNHIHILLTPQTTQDVPRFMQSLGVNYVPYFNREYERSGSLWEGRFKSSLIFDESYLISAMRYIELNPVRAGMVAFPHEYKWTSFMNNGYGVHSSFITPHQVYLNLGSSNEERCVNYQALFGSMHDAVFAELIRSAIKKEGDLGSAEM